MKKIYANYIFLGLLLLGISWFLLKDNGIWLYQDAFYRPIDRLNTWEIFKSSTAFNIYTNYGYYLGYNAGEFAFTRIIPFFPIFLLFNLVFGVYVGQLLFIISGVILAFWFSQKLASIFISNKEHVFIVAIFYTFNPYLVALLNQSYIHVYAGLPLLLYSIYMYFSNKYLLNKYLLFLFLAVFILLSYLRFIFIGIILGTIFFLFFIKKFKLIFKKIGVLIGLFILVFLPIIVSYFGKIMGGGDSASSNFASVFKGYIPSLGLANSLNLYQYINIQGIYENSFIYISISVLLIGILIRLMVLRKYKKDTTKIGLIFLVIGLFFMNMGQLINSEYYNILIQYFGFLQNVPQYGGYFVIFGLRFIILTYRNKVLEYLILLFSVVTILPLFFNQSNTFSKVKVDESYSKDYINKFYTNYGDSNEPTLYFFDWCWKTVDRKLDYDICKNSGLKYASIAMPNPRILNGDAFKLSTKITNQEYPLNLANLRFIYNLKNIIIPEDLNEDGYNYQKLINFEDNLKVLDRSDLYLVETNDNFTHYKLKNYNNYNYLLYSPLSLEKTSIDDFWLRTTKLPKGAVISDKRSLYLNEKINIKINKNTRYYFQVDGDNKGKINIQLNQSFDKNWKIKNISQEEFNSLSCKGYKFFEETNNSTCYYGRDLILFIKSIFRPSVGYNHNLGNFINNNRDLDINKKDRYFVIIYESQFYYLTSIFVSLGSAIFLLYIILFKHLYSKKEN